MKSKEFSAFNKSSSFRSKFWFASLSSSLRHWHRTCTCLVVGPFLKNKNPNELPLFCLSQDADTAFGDSDEDQKDDLPPSAPSSKPTEDRKESRRQERPHTSSGASPLCSLPGGQGSRGARDSILQSASLSVQEQHTTNMLLETVSRSLELLSESVQQLAETQQEFVRESLQLQRDMVQVLRDFTGGAIALMHDKMNGRPSL